MSKKNTNKDRSESVMLCRAHSIVSEFAGRQDVMIQWLCVGRKEPIVSSLDILVEEGFDEQRDHAECYLNELFTEDEVDKVRLIMEGYHDLAVCDDGVELPIKLDPVFPDKYPKHSRNRVTSNVKNYWIVKVGKDLPLPFDEIWGFFDLTEAELTEGASAEIERMARLALPKALKAVQRFLCLEESDIEEEIKRKNGVIYDLYTALKIKATAVFDYAEALKDPQRYKVHELY